MEAKSTDISEAPFEHLIIFDGVCYLCSGSVRFLLKRDSKCLFRFTSAQSAIGTKVLAAHRLDPENPDSFIYLHLGQAAFKSDAVLKILKILPAPWRWLNVLRIIPTFMRDWLYDRIALNRYSLFGRAKSCILPSTLEPERILSDLPHKSTAQQTIAGPGQ